MKLPDGNGLELINLCQQRYPDMPIAMITAYGNLELGVSALKAGAFDVVAKPIDTERLRELTRQAMRLTQTPTQIDTLRSEEHTSELQSRPHLVCRLLLEKKK